MDEEEKETDEEENGTVAEVIAFDHVDEIVKAVKDALGTHPNRKAWRMEEISTGLSMALGSFIGFMGARGKGLLTTEKHTEMCSEVVQGAVDMEMTLRVTH